MHCYIKRQWRSPRFTTSYDKQLASWHTFTFAFYTTSARQIPLSTDGLPNYHQHQHTPSICPPQPRPVTLHHPDHESAHHHSLPSTPRTHLLLPLHPSVHRLASENNRHHHHSTHTQTGMPGMVTLIVASWSSKPTPSFDPIGSLLPDGSDTPLSSAKLDGKSFKICKEYRTPNRLNPLHLPQMQRS